MPQRPRTLVSYALFIAALSACDGGTDAPAVLVPAVGTFDGPDTSQPDTSAEPDRNPCGDVPHEGRCIGNTLERCITGTGSSGSFVSTSDCGAGFACVTRPLASNCEPNADCRPGDAECRGETLAVCNSGSWQTTACANGCNDSVAGAGCRPGIATVRYSNTISFEYRTINTAFTDWSSEVASAPARRFLVLSYADGELLDSTLTDDNGWFELDAVPAQNEDADDFIALFAARAESDGSLAYAIMDPVLPATTQDVEGMARNGSDSAQAWYWTWGASDIASDTGVYLSIAAGSGAAFAFDYLSTVYDYSESFFGRRAGTTLALWLGYGTTWSCGACFFSLPAVADGFDFASQIFMPAGADESFWSGAVLAHELGHWVMSTYGVSPGEGGRHILGVPTHPGIAWSEGFATWFSSVVRDQGFYYDKQQGLFFWVDLANRAYSSGAYWTRPVAQDGLEQLIDENEVTRMLLDLTSDATFAKMFAALSSPRMTVAPFLRGYAARTWDGLDAQGRPFPAWSTGVSAPHLADYFDALVCGGEFSPPTVDQSTQPGAHYPYPSTNPLCRESELPIQVSWRDTPSGTNAEVRWYLPLDADLVLRFVPGGVAHVIQRGTPPGSLSLAFAPSLTPNGSLATTAARPDALAVDLSGEHWSVHGAVPYRAATLARPTRTQQHLALGHLQRSSIPLSSWTGPRAPRRATAITGLPSRLPITHTEHAP